MNEQTKQLWTAPPAELLTPRLRLRALTKNDTELLLRLYANDPETCRYMSFRAGRPEETAAFVAGAAGYWQNEPNASVRDLVWILELRNDGTPLGSCGVGPTGRAGAVGGGYILHPAFWGQGYASEAWCTVVDWARMQPGVLRIEAQHHPDNPASGRVMERAGMGREGVLRRWTVYPNLSDEPQDAVMYSWVRSTGASG